MEYPNQTAEEGYTPAKESIKAINKNLNGQIIFGVCNLLYYASDIIEERVDDISSPLLTKSNAVRFKRRSKELL